MTDDSAEPAPDTAGTTAGPGMAANSLRALRAARAATTETATPETATPETATTEADTAATDTAATDTAATDTAEAAAEVTEPETAELELDDRATDHEPPTDVAARRHVRGRPGTASSSGADRPRRRRPDRLTTVCGAVAAASLVFGLASGVVWWRADHDSAGATATARDEVAVDARLAIATVNTSDYRKPTVALSNWLDVSTGTLKSEFADSRSSATTLLKQAKAVTSAVVLDAAVTRLDTGKGSATVIASVNVKRKPVSGAATTTRNRFRATLSRVGDDWKLANLTLVPVALT